VNPRRKPVTQADVDRAKRDGVNQAIHYVWSLFFTVLRDKEGYNIEDLKRIWAEVEDLSDSVKKGYCTISDLKYILKTEEGAVIRE
jgi:hypothetical protein